MTTQGPHVPPATSSFVLARVAVAAAIVVVVVVIVVIVVVFFVVGFIFSEAPEDDPLHEAPVEIARHDEAEAVELRCLAAEDADDGGQFPAWCRLPHKARHQHPATTRHST